MREAVRALLDLVLPVSCAGCAAPGQTWCPQCRSLLGAPVRVRPPCCAAAPAVYALGDYRGPLRTTLLAYKEHGRRDLAAPLGEGLAAGLLGLRPGPGWPGPASGRGGRVRPVPGPVELCLVPVPSRWSATVRRGGQHVALLAERAAAALAGAGVGTAVAPALRMAAGVRDSVGLGRAARQSNLDGRVLVRPAGLPMPGAAVVVVDDVVTTGSTVATCTTSLLQAGVAVGAIVVLATSGRHAPS